MREMKVRGKRKFNGKWVFGSLVHVKYATIIADWDGVSYYDVDPDTVGQYTGLKDRNGREIYEGDILRDEFDRVFRVYWVDGEARFAIRQKKRKTEYFMVISHIHPVVIGNIWDNPELLKGDENT